MRMSGCGIRFAYHKKVGLSCGSMVSTILELHHSSRVKCRCPVLVQIPVCVPRVNADPGSGIKFGNLLVTMPLHEGKLKMARFKFQFAFHK